MNPQKRLLRYQRLSMKGETIPEIHLYNDKNQLLNPRFFEQELIEKVIDNGKNTPDINEKVPVSTLLNFVEPAFFILFGLIPSLYIIFSLFEDFFIDKI